MAKQPFWVRFGVCCVLVVMVWLGLTIHPAWATEASAQTLSTSPDSPTSPSIPSPTILFETHCVGCHPGGGNIIRRGKTLKTKALQRYGYDTPAAIADIITNGKGVMSAFGDRLTPGEINTLAELCLIKPAITGPPEAK